LPRVVDAVFFMLLDLSLACDCVHTPG
jgi:hypothetical protein